MSSSSDNDASIQSLLGPQNIAATAAGSAVTLAGSTQQGAALIVAIGADSTGTGSTCSAQLQNSADGGSTWQNVGAASHVAAPGTPVTQLIPFAPNAQSGLQYRVQVTVGVGSGAAPTFPISVSLVSSLPR